jgi:hypothetical protein
MVSLRCKVTALDGQGYNRKQSQSGDVKTKFLLHLATEELWAKYQKYMRCRMLTVPRK